MSRCCDFSATAPSPEGPIVFGSKDTRQGVRAISKKDGGFNEKVLSWRRRGDHDFHGRRGHCRRSAEEGSGGAGGRTPCLRTVWRLLSWRPCGWRFLQFQL